MGINIRDVNDNYPHIQSNPLYIEMEEESPVNKTVLCLNEYVTDNDFGQHAVLKYELHGQEEFFMIDEKTGCITTKRVIDREILPSYWENTLETPVRICDNQKIDDDDIEIVENNENNDVFAKFSKDEENKAAIQAKIRAEKVKKENYNNQLCIKAIVKILIKDVLDKKPTWSSKIRKTTKFNVYEDTQIGNEIGKIPLATDLDDNDPVDYCMINENEGNLPFKLYDDVLTLVGQVDYEKKKEYQIYVHAINSKDFGTCVLYRRFLELNPNQKTPTSSILPITIKIRNVNDNPPTFIHKEKLTALWYDSNIGKIISDFEVNDIDGLEGLKFKIFRVKFYSNADNDSNSNSNIASIDVTNRNLFELYQENDNKVLVKIKNTLEDYSHGKFDVLLQVTDKGYKFIDYAKLIVPIVGRKHLILVSYKQNYMADSSNINLKRKTTTNVDENPKSSEIVKPE